MKAASFSMRVLLTESAKAVQLAPTFQVSPALQQYLLSVQQWDGVVLPPCTTTFVVLARTWHIEKDKIELCVILDLPAERPPLNLASST